MITNNNIKNQTRNQKKLTVTIGIPAYNEEINIGTLLRSLLLQEREGFVINEIIVISDGSTDRTVEEVKKINNKIIKLIDRKTRKGQTDAQNRIFKTAKSKTVVLIEADTIPKNKHYLLNLLKPIINNAKIGFVQGNEMPLEAKTLFGKIIRRQFCIFYKFATNDQRINSWLTSGRGGRAFTKNVFLNLRWPSNVPEDTFALLWCKKNDYSTIFATSAVSFYKSPENYHDFQKEIIKVSSGRNNLEKYFSQELVKKIYEKPLLFNIKCSLYFLCTSPIFFMIYIFVKSLNIRINKQFLDILPIAETTKML